ncbi:MAG: methyltransferase domain-containing protein [Oscillospiraceae bacterium]|jgi:ubiquinone/menaquinone biosynthesis C-methylase UbiE|nr:methyltransferase domain-containing protein [Oscillospiraceae bacterium]
MLTEPKFRHPGGRSLTLRAARLAGIARGDAVLDIACGDGATVALLRSTHGANAVGADIAAEGADFIVRADASALPFRGAEFGFCFMECALSVISDREAALSEAARVLSPRGKLVFSDLYNRRGETPFTLDGLRRMFADSGFAVLFEEDHTPALVTYAAENPDCACEFGGARGLGYILMVCEKEPQA